MAHEVYTREEILLQDDTEVVLRPLPIMRLKKFMKLLSNMGEGFDESNPSKNEEDGLDEIFSLALFCLEKNPATVSKSKEDLGDIVDLPTAYKIIEVCGGVKLNDPKLMEVAMNLAAQEQAGTN